MLPSLDFEGTAKVINKGVDVTLLVTHRLVDKIFKLTRVLSVCGVSAAVLELTELDPIDQRTLEYYERTSDAFIVFEEEVDQAVRAQIKTETECIYIEGAEEKKDAQLIFEIKQVQKKEINI